MDSLNTVIRNSITMTDPNLHEPIKPEPSHPKKPYARDMLLSLTLVLIISCSLNLGQESNITQTVQGQVLGIKSKSLLELDELQIRDELGTIWQFESKNTIDFTPSHLRQHMLQGIPVVVTYRLEDNALIIHSITD